MSCHVRTVIIQGMTRVKGFFPLKLLNWEMLEPNALLWDQGSQKDVLWCSSPASGSHASRPNTIDGVSMPYCMWRSWARFHLSSGWWYCMRWWCGHKQGRPAASAPSCQGCGLANLIQIQNLEKSTNTNKYIRPVKEKRLLANQRAAEMWNF